MSRTSIEWTEATWNPVRGCSPVSPGCKNCYAEHQAGRFCGPGKPFHGFVQIGKNGNPGPHWTGKVELVEHKLDAPGGIQKPTMFFVNSMSDLFHESLPDEAIDLVFLQMACAERHTFQVLTKRADRMNAYIRGIFGGARVRAIRAAIEDVGWPLPNVWLGVSAEDQERADERIPLLLQTPAALRFVSAEPLLGPIDLSGAFPSGYACNCGCGYDTQKDGIDWVIVGGESGPRARPCDVAWIRSIRDQCKAAEVACFIKQYGAKPFDGAMPAVGRYRKSGDDRLYLDLKDRKGGDISEWDEDLRVRQMPIEGERHA